MLSILLLTVEARNTICNYIYHKLAQIWSILTKSHLTIMLTISDISLAALSKRFLQVKQLNGAEVFITRLQSYIIPNITLV